jgi:hypothetical protein
MIPPWLQLVLDGVVYVGKRLVPKAKRPKPGPDVPRFDVSKKES